MTLLTTNSRSQLTERVLTSAHFEKSPRLRSFLRFICEQELAGNREGINEQLIGVGVFGRQPGYNPGDDSIVRSQARFLRQRLEEYFRTEGAEEPLRIVIPKGSYVPLFESNTQARDRAATLREDHHLHHHLEEELQPLLPHTATPGYAADGRSAETSAVPNKVALAWRQSRPRVWIAGACVALAACLLGFASLRTPAPLSPQGRFWAAIFSGRSSIIVPADSTLVLLEELSQQPVHLNDYLSRHDLSGLVLRPGLESLHTLDLGNSQYTSVADLNLASEIMRNVQSARQHAQIRYARDLSISDAKQNNLVLIGGARANPWVELFAGRMMLYVDYDWASGHNVVTDRRAHPGEPALYAESPADPQHRVYGLIAFLPSLDQEGNTLLVAGTSSAGTEAAADFLLNSTQFDAYFAQRVRPGQKLPHFEMLVEAQSVRGKSPQSRVISYQALP